LGGTINKQKQMLRQTEESTGDQSSHGTILDENARLFLPKGPRSHTFMQG
jgi:hypothetical protein